VNGLVVYESAAPEIEEQLEQRVSERAQRLVVVVAPVAVPAIELHSPG
jgi:hypothetical protein